jgi:predicted DNA-binding transcriptional regulator YafY
MTNDDDNVIRLEGTEWYSAQELADRLDVSVRTIYRRLERGQIEKRETPRGTVYRLRENASTDSSDVTHTDASSDTKFGEAVLRLVERTGQQSDRIAELTGEVSRLEAKLEAALEDRERLLRYVETADERIDELADELESREEELMKTRAREYLESGRREMSDERLDNARAKIAALEDEKRELIEQLAEANRAKKGWSPFG